MTERYNSNISGINTTTLTSISTTLGNLLLTSGSLNATFNSNTIGSLFTTGGNIGINNTTPSYTLDVSGIIKTSSYTFKPNIPTFRVYGVAFTGVTVAAGNTLKNLTIDYNNGSYYNNSTGLFTAPVTGYYLAHINTYGSSGANGWFTVNGAYVAGNLIQPPGGTIHYGFSNIIPLTAGNTLGVYCNVGTFYFYEYDGWGTILLC